MIEEYFDKPIPNLDEVRRKKIGYRSIPVSPQDEEVVNLLDLGISGTNYYYEMGIREKINITGVTKNLYARKNVAEKLININKQLKTLDLELFIIDAFRSVKVQNFLHDEWAPKSLQQNIQNGVKKK